jgi:hypothetical protein
MPLRNFSILCP